MNQILLEVKWNSSPLPHAREARALSIESYSPRNAVLAIAITIAHIDRCFIVELRTFGIHNIVIKLNFSLGANLHYFPSRLLYRCVGSAASRSAGHGTLTLNAAVVQITMHQAWQRQPTDMDCDNNWEIDRLQRYTSYCANACWHNSNETRNET